MENNAKYKMKTKVNNLEALLRNASYLRENSTFKENQLVAAVNGSETVEKCDERALSKCLD